MKKKWMNGFKMKGSFTDKVKVSCYKCPTRLGIYTVIIKQKERKACGTCFAKLREKRSPFRD